MNAVPSSVISDLMKLGEDCVIGADVELHLSARLAPFDWLNRLHWQSWDSVTEKISLAELENLARGLVRAEKNGQWSGGSVAGAIWVFRMFQKRFPQDANGLAEWMLKNSNNPYVPYGSNRGDARSLIELDQQNKAKAKRKQASKTFA
jgi:hypothetical protein